MEQKNKSVFDFLSEVPAFYDLTPKKLSDIAFRLGLNSGMFFSEQVIQTLSGGEKVKLQFARILMTQPDALLLDEPSNDIDIDTLEWLEKFINSCEVPVGSYHGEVQRKYSYSKWKNRFRF